MVRLLTILLVSLSLVPVAHAGNRLPFNDDERQWLDTVDPIITLKERRTFRNKIKSHEGRAQFIELFWAKRDPNLQTEVNEFEEAYLERLAYAEANFNERDSSFYSLSMYQLYIMLGEPDRRTYWLDPALFAGTSYRYRFRYRGFGRHRPELWEYENPGYGFKRKTLKVQFVPSTIFGDYIALTDSNYNERFLETLREKLIVNPDIELAPVAGSLAMVD